MIGTLTALLLSCAPLHVAPQEPQDPLSAVARTALAADATAADQAIARLRAAGPAGLQAFLAEHRDLAAATAAADGPLTAAQQRCSAAMDRIGAQRDNRFAQLYWFTDFDAAQAEAKRTGRPILSLHLLGRLDEELSCANSRFFRMALYANAQVGALLRERFVLHWQSVRPAPKVTVDYGDGRKLETTITGNSIHYVLTASGAIVDALPGLYGPGTFTRELAEAAAFAQHVGAAGAGMPMSRHWHAAALRAAAAAGAARIFAPVPAPVDGPAPAAAVAAERAVSKGVVEAPMLRGMFGASVKESLRLTPVSGDQLDASSRRMFATKCVPEVRSATAQLAAAVTRFEMSMATDTALNQALRASILGRLLAEPVDLPMLDQWVYSALFLTPANDPWLGLLEPNGFTGIENGGVRR